MPPKAATLTSSKPSARLLYPVLLAVLTVGLFLSAVGYDFVNWDDNYYVSENPTILSFGPSNIVRWFTRPIQGHYIPLVTASFALDHLFFDRWAGGYHLTNLLLHLANVLLSYFLLCYLLRDRTKAAFCSILFAIYPTQAESVVWISERKTLLFSFFFLSLMNLYVRESSSPEHRKRKILPIAAFWAAALLSKTTAVVVPLILITFDYFHEPQALRQKLKKVSFALAAAFLLLALLLLLLFPMTLSKLISQNPAVTLAGGLESYIEYFRLLFLGGPFRFFYYTGLPSQHGLSLSWSGLLVLTGILALSLWALIKKQSYGFWLLWILLLLLPVSGFTAVSVNQRHLYLAVLAVGPLLFMLLRNFPRVVYTTLIFLILLSLALCPGQIRRWQDSRSLWQSVLSEDPTNHRALMQLGDYYRTRQDQTNVEKIYNKLIRQYPYDADVFTNLAGFYAQTGSMDRLRKTAALFEQRQKDHPDVFLVKAMIAFQEHQPEQAITLLEQAAERGSRRSSVYVNLVNLYLERNRIDDAEKAIKKFEHIYPLHPDCSFTKALRDLRSKNFLGALKYLLQAEQRGSLNPVVYFQTGLIYSRLNNTPQAIVYFKKTLAIEPKFFPAAKALRDLNHAKTH